MEPNTHHDHDTIVRLLEENQALLKENNALLHAQESRERRRLIFKVVWYAMLLGLPLLAYYYLYTTFIALVGSSANGVLISPETLQNVIDVYAPQ